jgi:hypothetical protein
VANLAAPIARQLTTTKHEREKKKMGAMKRELERLADIVIYGNAETIEREFRKVDGLGGSLTVLAQAVEMARYMSPLCECGEDYHEGLKQRFPQYIQDTNKESEGATL